MPSHTRRHKTRCFRLGWSIGIKLYRIIIGLKALKMWEVMPGSFSLTNLLGKVNFRMDSRNLLIRIYQMPAKFREFKCNYRRSQIIWAFKMGCRISIRRFRRSERRQRMIYLRWTIILTFRIKLWILIKIDRNFRIFLISQM